jgi:nitroimidazol reductase NimA-like FMN-containing flavoprotein (pyridoxamine 5'-phosphate oxidase superfamily)
MPMQIRELTMAECLAMLQATNLGRLACVRYNRPYIVPVYFDLYRDALYSFATVGKKIQWMRTNPRVCVEFDQIADRFNWTTVVVRGRYEELTKSPAHQAARRRAYALFENRPDWWYPAAGKMRSSEIRTPVIYRIQIEALSGRRAARDPKKIARDKPAPSVARAPHWWSHVLRPLQGPPKGFK